MFLSEIDKSYRCTMSEIDRFLSEIDKWKRNILPNFVLRKERWRFTDEGKEKNSQRTEPPDFPSCASVRQGAKEENEKECSDFDMQDVSLQDVVFALFGCFSRGKTKAF